MRDDDAEGRGYASHHVGTPTSNFRRGEPVRGEGQGPEGEPHSFAPPLAHVFGVDVHGLLFFGHSFACNTADGA